MKRFLGLVVLYGAASCIAAHAEAPTTATKKIAVSHSRSGIPNSAAAKEAKREAALRLLAPADEYFGPLKLSIIGIRNTMKDAGLRYDVDHDRAPQAYGTAAMTERAIRDWERKYPHDDQVPRAIYYLQRLYTKVLSQESRDHAHAVALWLFKDYASSGQSKQLRKTLAVEKLAPVMPLVAAGSATSSSSSSAAAAAASPAPGQYQSAFGSAYPSAFSAASPAPVPATHTNQR